MDGTLRPPLAGFRRELKFLVDESVRSSLAAHCAELCAPDPHGSDGGYRVRSVYFESPGLDSYRHKLAGVSERGRFRLRAYGAADGERFLEHKQRSGPLVRKQRVRVQDGASAQALVDPSWEAPEGDPGPRFQRDLRLLGLRPLLRVDFERRAFAARGGGRARLTIDRDVRVLRSTELEGGDAPTWRLLPRGHSIVELKVDGAPPAWFAALAARLDLVRAACSKYCLAVEVLGRQRGLPFG